MVCTSMVTSACLSRKVHTFGRLFVANLLVALLYLYLCAPAESTPTPAESALGGPEAKEVILTGINSCQACGKTSASGETAQGAKCSIFGHSCTFIIETAKDMDGKEIEDLKKKELNYRLNQQSIPLVKSDEYQGARLEIKGKWLKEKREIEVTSFKRIEK
ncbi:MAG TPA: hypothetical protein ACFYD3_03010 [Candidatus Hypogeohydataceae bacterium YC41]